MSRQHRAMALRRDRVMDVALNLLSQIDARDLTMQRIAAAADLSPATMFNMFKSKDLLLRGLVKRDEVRLEVLIQQNLSGDSLDNIFDVVRIISKVYRSNPNFYRIMFLSDTHRTKTAELNADSVVLRVGFWRSYLQSLVDGGFLRADLCSQRRVQPNQQPHGRAQGAAGRPRGRQLRFGRHAQAPPPKGSSLKRSRRSGKSLRPPTGVTAPRADAGAKGG